MAWHRLACSSLSLLLRGALTYTSHAQAVRDAAVSADKHLHTTRPFYQRQLQKWGLLLLLQGAGG